MSWRTLSRRRFLQAAVATGAAVAAAPRFGRAAAGGTLRVRDYADLQVLDPAFFLGTPEANIFNLIFHRLIVFKGGQDTSWELDAAASIEQVDDRHVKFVLRPGIQWTGDFGEMTAEDVKFSFERLIDEALESPYAGDWAALDHVEITDKYSGVIVLNDYSATLWTISLPGSSGCILCKRAVEALPDKKFTTEVPASSGPYVIAQWTPKQNTTLERNPVWSGSPQHWERIVIHPIEDSAAAGLAFEAGELDFTGITLSTLARYRRDGPPAGAKIIDRPSLAYVWIGMNVDNPALGDIRVRRAIQKAIDVQAAVDAAYFGIADRATGIIAPGLIGHRDIAPMARDLAGAKALLEEAGVQGLSLTIDIGLETEYATAAQVVQASLAEAGIDLTINQRDSGTFWTLGDESAGDQWKDVQLILNRFAMNPDPSYATEWFTPDQIGVWNWERFNSPEFAELHAKAKGERDPATRARMYVRMQELMEDSGAYVFMTHERLAYIHRESIEAVIGPDGDPMLSRFKPV